MMRFCQSPGCENWAQWVIITPDKSIFMFCAGHKDKLVKEIEPEELKKFKINFAGAIPNGLKIA